MAACHPPQTDMEGSQDETTMDRPPALSAADFSALQRQAALFWPCPGHDPADTAADLPWDPAQARARLQRFAGLLHVMFPALAATQGQLTSPLVPVPELQAAWPAALDSHALPAGHWYLKRDDALPVAGSVKARGGFHEVLARVERLGLAAGRDAQAWPSATDLRRRFAHHALAVGSTGNLGLAIGLIGRGFGFDVTVHMSTDAKAWKKDRLRQHGIRVVEHDGDYAAAVAAGRAAALHDPRQHFVDDERSPELFLGYAAAAAELRAQLQAAGRPVDARHPLFVYLPCGVGGAPGGVTYGLKRLLGPHVHCFFTEPVAAPAMLLQLAVGTAQPVSVHDIGLDNRTAADGLAVAQASTLVAPIMARLLAGVFTVTDAQLFAGQQALEQAEGIYIEPSAAAALAGPGRLLGSTAGRAYIARHGLATCLPAATHVMWSTGGALVPEHVRAEERARLAS